MKNGLKRVYMSNREKELIQQIKIGGTYKHYKEKYYRVIMLSRNVEDYSLWVIYEPLYHHELGSTWHRKLEDFLEIGVWIENAPAMPRFTLVNEQL
jgi:hypothetical protein